MTDRSIIVSNEVELSQNEKGQFIVHRPGSNPYPIKPTSSTYFIVKILDLRCDAQKRKYDYANDVIHSLQKKLERIESTFWYKSLHLFGLI